MEQKLPQNETEQIHNVLQRIAKDNIVDVKLPPGFAQGLHDYRPMGQVPMHAFGYWYQRYPENRVHDNAIGLYSGNGGGTDHHHAQELFHETFSQHPELIKAYTQGQVR